MSTVNQQKYKWNQVEWKCVKCMIAKRELNENQKNKYRKKIMSKS